MTQGYAFLPDALETNAGGRMTEAQRDMMRVGSFVKRFLPIVTGDLRKGKVRCIEGAMRKTVPVDLAQSTVTSGMMRYYLEINGESFEVPSKAVWDTVPGTGYFRLYYLPHSKTVINLERLPDPPVNASSVQDVREAVADAVGASLRPSFTKHGSAEKAERMAHADAVIRAATSANQPIPGGPANAADLVGRWTSMFFNVEVRADGTLSMDNPQGGPAQQGHWRVSPDGQLHLTFQDDPDEVVTPIAVAGDRLQVEIAGQPMTLQRAG